MATQSSIKRASSPGAFVEEPFSPSSCASRTSLTRSTRSIPSLASISSSPASSDVSLKSAVIRGPEGWTKCPRWEALCGIKRAEKAPVGPSTTMISLTESLEATLAYPIPLTDPNSIFPSLSSSKVGRTLSSFASFLSVAAASIKLTAVGSKKKTASPGLASYGAKTSVALPQLDLTPVLSSDLHAKFLLDNYNATYLLHVIWGEVHPWQLTLDPATFTFIPSSGYHLVHVPRAHPRFRLKKTIRRVPVPVCGGLVTRSVPFSSDGKPNQRLTAIPPLKELCRPERLRPSEYEWLVKLCKEVPQAYEGPVVDLFSPHEVFCTLRGRIPSF
ncbi:hypothetical protein JCM6882_005228 [Rhodosporidiobolus microsporus]